MPISFDRYVDITSGVGGTSAVRERDLIGRLFTTNELVPTGGFLEFNSADDVSAYFGSTSEEHLRSVFYFGWISKSISSPEKISFGRWADTDTAPQIFGDVSDYAISDFTGITSGSITMTLGPDTNTISSIDFSTAASLSDVATILQTAIRTQTGTMWTSATVTYNATRKSFDFEGGDTGSAVISVDTGVVASAVGWETGAIFSNGADTETVTDTLSQSEQASNNFASFLFMEQLTDDEIVEAATWNDAKNVMYMYTVPATAAKASTYYSLLSGLSGVTVTLQITDDEYAEMVPMIILAATDYDKINSVQNYMFQEFDLTPSVTNNTDANTYDAVRTNYYGQTQTAGQNLSFYQRGLMMGLSTDPVDQNVYANEIWLKDNAAVQILGLLLALPKVSANVRGQAQIQAILQNTINLALRNGTISVGKTLTTIQKLYIANTTGDDEAWRQVEQQGYWLDVTIEPYTGPGGTTEYKAIYTLIYSKDDVVRKVDGTHVLI